MEVARQLSWSRTDATLSHFRTKDGVEVDLVLENRLGQVIGIKVKASSTPGPEDFRGLRHLAQRVGDDFLAGDVLHTGQRTLPAGPSNLASPHRPDAELVGAVEQPLVEAGNPSATRPS